MHGNQACCWMFGVLFLERGYKGQALIISIFSKLKCQGTVVVQVKTAGILWAGWTEKKSYGCMLPMILMHINVDDMGQTCSTC